MCLCFSWSVWCAWCRWAVRWTRWQAASTRHRRTLQRLEDILTAWCGSFRPERMSTDRSVQQYHLASVYSGVRHSWKVICLLFYTQEHCHSFQIFHLASEHICYVLALFPYVLHLCANAVMPISFIITFRNGYPLCVFRTLLVRLPSTRRLGQVAWSVSRSCW